MHGALGAAAVFAISGSALAQDMPAAGVAPRMSIVPRVSVIETYSNNALLDNANRRSDFVSEFGPGIRISSTGGRIRGSLDYALHEIIYANNSRSRQSQNSLNATATADIVDNWLSIDLNGNVGQQAISAFKTPGSGGVLPAGNSTETSVFRVSPHVRGRLANMVDYDARYSVSSTSNGSAAVADSSQRDAAIKLSAGQPSHGLSWAFDGTHQAVDYSTGRATSSSLLNARLQYALSEHWASYAKLGHENNDYAAVNTRQGNFTAVGVAWTPAPDLKASLDRDSRGFTGLGINWAPSNRTSVVVTREGRLYGSTHNVALAYRTPSTAWTFSDSRSAVSSPAGGPGFQTVSLYDLLSGQFAATEPDLVKREQYNAFLQANGITPGLTAVSGFLSSSLSLQRTQQLSFALFGARSTVSLAANRSQNTRLDTLTTAVDDFVTSNVVVQNGLTANYSYRLTGKSIVSLLLSRQVTSGSAGVAGTSLKSFNVNLSTQLTRETSASLGARRVVYDNITVPYSETAITGNLLVQF